VRVPAIPLVLVNAEGKWRGVQVAFSSAVCEEQGVRIQWCWRCRADVPMLDDDEHARVWAAYERSRQTLDETIRSAVRVEGRTATLPDAASIPTEHIFSPVRDDYAKITGSPEVTDHALRHHRISKYGPPCKGCGKPLRTPKARSCAVCGLSA
jgi:hypothetical protein